MERVFDVATWRDPCPNEPESVTVDLRAPGWREVVRAKAAADAAWLFQDAEALDDLDTFEGDGPGIHAAYHTAMHFSGQSMSIPREAFCDLLAAKRQRNILKRLYRRYLEQATMALMCARQAARAKRSRQHKRRLHR